MKVLRVKEKGFRTAFKAIQQRTELAAECADRHVRAILEDVKARGDQALIEHTTSFDKVVLSAKEIPVQHTKLEQAWQKLLPKEQESLVLAKERIERFHRNQISRSWITAGEEGEVTGQVFVPIEKVGIYVPGGKASYPSSVLMNAIPATVAGVSEIVMVTPPAPKGVSVYTLAAARLCGIEKVFQVGGAQAIAALAYGTSTIPRVDKIVGPGNIFVAAAKKMVASQVGIDMIAGPSEILIIADNTATPASVAADLLSQAEHDEEAKVILLTPSETLALRVRDEIKLQAGKLTREKIVMQALSRKGCILICENLEQSVELANEIAPEHLMLAVHDPFTLLGRIKHAGSVFLGHFSPVAAGDYLAGPNHVLPTSGSARFSSPLGVCDFMKCFSITYFSKAHLEKLGEHIVRLARLEGLEAHARSVELRLKKSKNKERARS